MKRKRKPANPAIFIVIAVSFIAVMILNIVILFVAHLPANDTKTAAKPDAISSAPDWAIKYPQLDFLKDAFSEALVIEGNKPGKLFALFSNPVIESDYMLWFVDSTTTPIMRRTLDYGTLMPIGGHSIEKRGDYVVSTMRVQSGESDMPFYYQYYDGNTGNLAYEVNYLQGGMSRTVSVNLRKDRVGTNYMITPRFSPPCDFDNWSSPRQPTDFLGVDFNIDSAGYTKPKKFYPLPKPLTGIACNDNYDGAMGFRGPFTSAGIENGKIFFQADFGTKIVVDPNASNPVPVFENI